MLKLDRTLIQGFESDRDRRAMVAGMIALAHEAGLTAVAVGIEDRRQLGARAGARLLGGAGLSAAKARGARAPSAQRGARGGNVRAMASGRAAGQQRLPPIDDAAVARRQKRAAAHGSCRDGAGRDASRAGHGHDRRRSCCRRWPNAALSDLRCVATSPVTAQAARALGLRVDDPDEVGELDLAIDGADQIDPDGWLIKGGGGAHTREKIVACGREALRGDRLGRQGGRAADPAGAARSWSPSASARRSRRSATRACATSSPARTAA